MQLVALAKNPVPSGAVVGAFKGHDGVPLRFARWAATRGPRQGTICVFPGRGEFIEKYFEVIADLRRRGFTVATMDWRGQGYSHRPLPNPSKGHVRDFLEYDSDLLRFMKEVVLPDCPPPFYALAHSMGGHILLRNATMPGSWFKRIVACAPMIALHPVRARYPLPLLRAGAEAACLVGLSRSYVQGGSDRPEEMVPFERNALTSDKERWSRNKAVLEVAPDLGLGAPTYGWLRAALRSCAALQHEDYAINVQVPLLLFSAGGDGIVSTPAIEDFSVKLKIGTHVTIPAARHEILQETDDVRQRFWAAFDAYLNIESAVV